jgi:hypothetical protein
MIHRMVTVQILLADYEKDPAAAKDMIAEILVEAMDHNSALVAYVIETSPIETEAAIPHFSLDSFDLETLGVPDESEIS